MNMYHSDAYRAPFLTYIRKGTSIRLSTKETVATEQYVWRTQQDSKVRGAHRIHDGRIFSWSNAPPTGHPGQDFNCRCEAIPYIAGQTEYTYHDITTDLSSSSERWGDLDFVYHYYFGDGQSVDLRDIGHLAEIVEQYAWNDGAEGAFRRLADQIADVARENSKLSDSGAFQNVFSWFYNFGKVEFSHGNATVSGVFNGTFQRRGNMLHITGKSEFRFYDEFKDPVNLRIEVGGTPYVIDGEWEATFKAEVFKDEESSEYFVRD